MVAWQTRRIGPSYDVLAPDGSEIRLLAQVDGASMVHCTLAPGQTTQAVRHRGVEEVWFCLAGTGELWRGRAGSAATPGGPAGAGVQDSGELEEIVRLEPGVGVSIPRGVGFQFRATGSQALELVIATSPPWPGPDEAIATAGRWAPSRGPDAG